MLNKDEINWLTNNFKESVLFNEPMFLHTSLKIGGPADAYVEPGNKEDLKILIRWAKDLGIPYLIIGNGTNLLVKDKGIRGLVISLTKGLKEIKQTSQTSDEVLIYAEAGVRMKKLCMFLTKKGLNGIQFALGIPGTFGGAVKMNAGTFMGSISDVIDTIDIIDNKGFYKKIYRKDLKFVYRGLSSINGIENSIDKIIILGGEFRLHTYDPDKLKREAKEILKVRYLKQPIMTYSAGCFFKNPSNGQSAGVLIDQAGLKGKKIRGAEISVKHANFIINREHATAGDVLELVSIIQETVYKRFQIKLIPEVQIVGE